MCLHCQLLAKKIWCLHKSLYLLSIYKKKMSINHEKYCVHGQCVVPHSVFSKLKKHIRACGRKRRKNLGCNLFGLQLKHGDCMQQPILAMKQISCLFFQKKIKFIIIIIIIKSCSIISPLGLSNIHVWKTLANKKQRKYFLVFYK